MSYMSEQDRQHEEARDLCDYDSLACELSHCHILLERVLVFLGSPFCLCISEKEHEWHAALEVDIRAVLNGVNKPERDAESKPDTTQG